MKKKQSVILIIILLFVLGAAGWFLVGKQSQKDMDLRQDIVEVKSDNQQEEKQAVKEDMEKTEDIDTSNWKTYRNEESGFEMKLPGDLKKWNVKVKHIDKEHSKFDSSKHYIIWFNYPLDQKILRSKGQPGMGYITDMDIWYIELVSVEDYKDNACEIKQTPKCRQGEILARNNRGVFISGFVSITGAGYLCSECCENEEKNNKCQKEFCEVFNALDFSSDDFLKAIYFKLSI